jgi:CheY-like chemotaxis protein
MSGRGPVLVVDDDPDIREALRDTLESEGYDAVGVTDGREALEYLRAKPTPPVILLDWNMAPMNGPEFMAEAAKDPVLSRIPVVLLTADARASEKSRSNGFVGYLMKPVDLDALFTFVGRYCG